MSSISPTSTHAQAWLRRVSDYHSGVGTPAERAAVEAHLSTCGVCEQALAQYQQLYRLAASPLRLGTARQNVVGATADPTAAARAETDSLAPGGATVPRQPILPRPRAPRLPDPQRRRRTLVAGLAAALVVALLTAGFVALLVPGHHPTTATTPTPVPTTAPTPTLAHPTPTLAPSPTSAPPTPTATPLPSSPFAPLGAPVLANGVVYVTTQNGNIYALNASTGAMLWQYHAVAVGGGPPTVANGVVYLTADDPFNPNGPIPSPAYLYALDASTGALLWRVPGLTGAGKLLVVNGVIYSGSYESYIVAYRASDGKVVWTNTLGGCSTNMLGYDATYLYINATSCLGLVAMRLSGGQGGWLSHGGGSGQPISANGVIYDGPFAIRPADGAILRRFAADGANGPDAFADGALYVSSGSALWGFNATTGAQIWQVSLQGQGHGIFGLANGILFVGPGRDAANLYAYRASDGALLWQAPVHPEVQSIPSLQTDLGDTVYVGTVDGSVVALRVADGSVLWGNSMG